jgi:hypothetical protein
MIASIDRSCSAHSCIGCQLLPASGEPLFSCFFGRTIHGHSHDRPLRISHNGLRRLAVASVEYAVQSSNLGLFVVCLALPVFPTRPARRASS